MHPSYPDHNIDAGSRTRAAQTIKEHDRDLLTARWKFAHDMCSLAACNQAFESCKKEDTYDLGNALMCSPGVT